MSDDDYQRLWDVSPQPMYVFSREDLRFLEVNAAACEYYGYSREELLAMTVRDIRAPEHLPRLDYALAEARANPEKAKYWITQHQRKNGAPLDVELTMERLVFRGHQATAVVVRHLTDAAVAEHRFRLLVEHAPDGITLVDEKGMVMYLSPGGERILGLKAADVLGRPSTDFLNTDDLRDVTWPAPGETTVNFARGRHGDGSWRWLEATITNMLMEPAIRARVTNFRDITERRLIEDSLRQSEANFRALIEKAPMLIIVSRMGRIVYVNPATAAALGYDDTEVFVGRHALDFIHPDDQARIADRMTATATTGSSPLAESMMIRKDGSSLAIEAQAVLLTFDGKPMSVLIGRDVTERRELFARIAVAERMMSVGTLAAGVAHEINNPLAYVISNLTILAKELPALLEGRGGARIDAAHVGGLIADAHEGAVRVSSIVRDLRALSRTDDETCNAVDVVEVLASSIKMAHNEIRHRATVLRSFQDPLPRVFANGVKLGQVFLNLLINAVQAIPEIPAEDNEIRLRAFTSPDRTRVVVEVEDTGVGIPPSVIGRIFDPFFTTKPIGVGTGLGLAICHQIVRSFGGEITVTSVPDRGTTVRVELPVVSGATMSKPRVPEPARVAEPVLRVLMIDDEPSVGRSSQMLLAPDHELVPVTRAKEALARIAAGEKFDVIICDLMMPEMSGIELFQQLVAMAPQYRERTVFMTGGAFTEQARTFLEEQALPTLDKPFSEDELRRAIQRASG